MTVIYNNYIERIKNIRFQHLVQSWKRRIQIILETTVLHIGAFLSRRKSLGRFYFSVTVMLCLKCEDFQRFTK